VTKPGKYYDAFMRDQLAATNEEYRLTDRAYTAASADVDRCVHCGQSAVDHHLPWGYCR
jgi:hypothetical protein